MKAELTGIKNQAGFATLEMLLALTILVLSFSAVILVVFGNQSISVDAQTNDEALYKAQAALEEARAKAREDFNSVLTTSTTTDPGGFYQERTIITDLSPCGKDVTSRVFWNIETRLQRVELKSRLTSAQIALDLGEDCDITEPGDDDWRNPTTLNSTDLLPAGNQASGLDVINKIVYMSAGSAVWDDFFVLDARMTSETAPPVIVGKVETGPGLNAVDVAMDLGPSGEDYAFVANNKETPPYNQLLVIDVTDINNPFLVTSASRSLPGVSGICPDYCPQGRSLFYYDHRLYIGTHRTGGHEFHIYDVSDPTNPIHKGSIELPVNGHNVNAIAVQKQLVGGTQKTIAYLATSSNTDEVFVFDVTDPLHITYLNSFDAKDMDGNPSGEDGTALYLSGGRLYLGRERVNNPKERDFYILDISDPLANPLPIVGSLNLQENPNTKVSGIRVVGRLAFLAVTDTTHGFLVLDIKYPDNITLRGKYNYSEEATGIDFEDNLVYTSNNKNDALRIIKSHP